MILSHTPSLAPICHQDIKAFPQFQFNSLSGQSSAMFVSYFAFAWRLNLLSSFSLPLIPLHLFCNQHLQNCHKMELMLSPFLQTTQSNLSSIVTFPTFSLLIMIFDLLTFTTFLTQVLISKLLFSLSGPQMFHQLMPGPPHRERAVYLDILTSFLQIVPPALW